MAKGVRTKWSRTVVDSLLLTPEFHSQLQNVVLEAGASDGGEWRRKHAIARRSQLSSSLSLVLYRASRDGRTPSDFHRLCDGRGPTVTVARVTNKALVGGFTNVAWESYQDHWNFGRYKADSKVRKHLSAMPLNWLIFVVCQAFLFNNRTDAEQVTKFAVKPGKTQNAVYHDCYFGPMFGEGDLHLLSRTDGECYSRASCYEFSGRDLTGIYYTNEFSVDDVEVFAV